MAQGIVPLAPGLSSFLKSLKTTPVDPSVEHLTSYSRLLSTLAYTAADQKQPSQAQADL